jgi:opacity protein-like surface antigen
MRAGQVPGKGRSGRALALLGASLLLALLAPAASASADTVPVRVTTGGVAHVTGTSGQLQGTVIADNIAVNAYFEYGPNGFPLPYASKTKAVTIPPANPVPPTPKAVKVGQAVTGLLVGYHYRICASFTVSGTVGSVCGKDKSFTGGKESKLRFKLGKGKEERLGVVYGGTLEVTGSLTGKNSANHGLTLQATPFPYTAPFATIGGTVFSSRTGSFLFRVARLTRDTEVRILTVDTRPIYSSVLTIHVSPRITLHVRSAGHTGLYRLYCTVTPARPCATVTLQELVPQKAGSKREGPASHSVARAILKRATKSLSRFSVIVKLSGTFHYRAFVKLPKGAIESGHSSNVLIKAPATKHKKKK